MIDCSTHSAYSTAVIGRSTDTGPSEALLIEQSRLEEALGVAVVQIEVAVDAALQAAKEAVGEQNKSNALAIAKSEATFTKQIDQIGVLISLDDPSPGIRAEAATAGMDLGGGSGP